MTGYGWLSALCLLGVVLQLHAIHLPLLGSCPNVSVITGFHMERYGGSWFQRAGYNTERVDGDVRCSNWLTELNERDWSLHVRAQGIDNKANVWREIYNGTIKFAYEYMGGMTLEAKLNLTLDTGANKVDVPYWVLGTDYTTYSVVYSCENHLDGLYHYYSVWLLDRTPFHLTDVEKAKFTEDTNRVLESQNITLWNIHQSDLSRCTGN